MTVQKGFEAERPKSAYLNYQLGRPSRAIVAYAA
jgi:hypothetical protein